MSILVKPYVGLNVPQESTIDDLLLNLLPSHGLGFLVGEPGVGKSFLALKLCASLATKTPFIHASHALMQENSMTGLSTGSYATLYLAGEREGKLPHRQRALIKSLEEEYGLTGYSEGLPIITCAIRYHSSSDLETSLIYFTKKEREYLESKGHKLRLIIVDTLQSALNVPSENGNSEIQYTMNNLRDFADKLGCFILVITHPAQTHGKSGTYSQKGVPRGASVMRGTADLIWHMEKVGNSGMHRLTVTKGSEGYSEGNSFYFSLRNYGGSAALVPVESPPDKKYESKDADNETLTLKDIGVLKAMEIAFTENGYAQPLYEDLGLQTVERGDVYTTLKRLHIEEAKRLSEKPIKNSAIGNRIKRGLERLLEVGLISSETSEDNETIYYPVEPWNKMESLMKHKFPTVNFAKVSFI
ncbi:MAG: AAA family ATPase [Alphaproteobacteria bacterium]|nr:AAA family ATPase [Alphaproteobacteria bacterium]